MDDELGGQVAPPAGHHGRAHREILLELELAEEFGSPSTLEAAHGGCRRVEPGGGGADDRVGLQEREIVHGHADHLLAASRERRYMWVASSGRFNRSSTIPSP